MTKRKIKIKPEKRRAMIDTMGDGGYLKWKHAMKIFWNREVEET